MSYQITHFDYTLPSALIAQFPTTHRSESRLMIVPPNDAFAHIVFSNVVDYLHEDDLVIFNNTRVIKARLFGVKSTGGKISGLVERVLDHHRVLMHLKSAPPVGTMVRFENAFDARVLARHDDLFELEFLSEKNVETLLESFGHLPLPPYITREVASTDLSRYQTIFAKYNGAVAAPTASLHFDETLLQRVQQKCDVGFLTLHVGAGTFQPVRVDDIREHVMHHEWMTVDKILCEKISACRARGGRVIAVGTTVLRALESAALSGMLQPFSGDTNIFIRPGFTFQVVDQLITNFHLPKSTLLMLACAFAGFDRVMQAYQEAIAQQYRFFSYGDAMMLYRTGEIK